MYKLVVLSALLALASSKPTGLYHSAPVPLAHGYSHGYAYTEHAQVVAPGYHQVAPVAYAAPAVAPYAQLAYAARAVAPVAPVAYPAPVAYASPAVAPVAYAAPAVQQVAPVVPAVAPVPAAQITKTVHYAETPVVTGYTSTVFKPDLGRLATPLHTVSQTPVVAPARAVETVVPQVTQVEPELHVQKVAVDVPVHTPVVSEVEYRTPVVQGPAVVGPAVHATPVVHSAPVVHSVPAVHSANVAHGVSAFHSAPLVHAAHAPAVHAW